MLALRTGVFTFGWVLESEKKSEEKDVSGNQAVIPPTHLNDSLI